MDQQKVDMYITTNQKYFPAEKITQLRDTLKEMRRKSFLRFQP